MDWGSTSPPFCSNFFLLFLFVTPRGETLSLLPVFRCHLRLGLWKYDSIAALLLAAPLGFLAGHTKSPFRGRARLAHITAEGRELVYEIDTRANFRNSNNQTDKRDGVVADTNYQIRTH